MQEMQVRSQGQEDLLEKEMVTHSSNLAWEIPWTEEPDSLFFLRSGTYLDSIIKPEYCFYKLLLEVITQEEGFPGGSVVKSLPAYAENTGLIPGSERSPGEGKGNPLQHSCLGNPMDKGAWRLESGSSQEC